MDKEEGKAIMEEIPEIYPPELKELLKKNMAIYEKQKAMLKRTAAQMEILEQSKDRVISTNATTTKFMILEAELVWERLEALHNFFLQTMWAVKMSGDHIDYIFRELSKIPEIRNEIREKMKEIEAKKQNEHEDLLKILNEKIEKLKELTEKQKLILPDPEGLYR